MQLKKLITFLILPLILIVLLVCCIFTTENNIWFFGMIFICSSAVTVIQLRGISNQYVTIIKYSVLAIVLIASLIVELVSANHRFYVDRVDHIVYIILLSITIASTLVLCFFEYKIVKEEEKSKLKIESIE